MEQRIVTASALPEETRESPPQATTGRLRLSAYPFTDQGRELLTRNRLVFNSQRCPLDLIIRNRIGNAVHDQKQKRTGQACALVSVIECMTGDYPMGVERSLLGQRNTQAVISNCFAQVIELPRIEQIVHSSDEASEVLKELDVLINDLVSCEIPHRSASAFHAPA